MIIHRQLSTSPQLEACVLTIGTFDGVHRGHQALVATAQHAAAERNLPVAVLTFADMPYCFFRPDDCPRLLTLPDEKAAMFEQLGVDYLWIVPFDAALAARSAEEFVAELKQDLGVQHLVVGPDFALGKGRAGNIEMLNRLGQHHNFGVQVLTEKITADDIPISSTRVRGAVEAGEIEAAAQMLGRPFSLAGEVITGQQLGRTIGVPTINLKIHPRKVVPAEGVYAARAYFGEQSTSHPAALSIGTNLTVGGESLSVEFHVIGENIEVPPTHARLETVAWLRGQEKFADIETLVDQMQRDIEQARKILVS